MSASPVVVVVEDEEDSRELLREFILAAGYDVEVATNGAEALSVLEGLRERPTVVLLDLMMPVMDGATVIDRLRAEGRLDGLTVFLVTAAPHLAPQGVRVVKKPIDLRLMMTMIATAVASAER